MAGCCGTKGCGCKSGGVCSCAPGKCKCGTTTCECSTGAPCTCGPSCSCKGCNCQKGIVGKIKDMLDAKTVIVAGLAFAAGLVASKAKA
mmetsp:Transcript_67570/g.213934  ORF Transcript_67570/g.213934 Transcript_67570/m.213934 type:complete len:89 (+) Transcript_67570:156-422(+)